jgi:hypothetical protein
MLEYHTSDEAKRAADASALWGNVVKPIMTDNTRKFLREASPEDIKIFESVAGDVLDALGYDRVYVRRGEERKFTATDLRFFDVENKRFKEEVLRGVDQEDLKRRDRQATLIAEIRGRQSGTAATARA